MPKPDVLVYPTHASRVLTWNGLSVRDDILYTDAKGEEHERSRKRAESALTKLQEILPSVLAPGETILYVIKNCQAPIGALEQFGLGWYVYRITSTTLVLTNLRLLHFAVDSGGKWTRRLRSVFWGDIAEAKVKGWLNRQLALKYASGKKESYWRLRRNDGKKAKDILAAVIPASRGEATAAQGMVSLCPECRAPLTTGVYQCNSCGAVFKNERTLLQRTILIPGGGYFYAGITFLGVLALFAEGIFTLLLFFFALQAVGIISPVSEPGSPVPTTGGLWVTTAFFAFILGVDKLVAYFHGRRMVRAFLPLKRPGQS